MNTRAFTKHFYYTVLNLLRFPIWRARKVTIGRHCRIQLSATLRNTKARNYCYIAQSTSVVNCEIGSYVSIGPNVVIGGAEHDYRSLSTSNFISTPMKSDLTRIGHDVWIGAGSVIRSGTRIGIGAVVGANSVVIRDVKPFEIVAGAPAKLIKYRFEDHTQAEIMQSKWWESAPSAVKYHKALRNITGQ